ncbi:MAG: hypothetical protein JWM71_101 [Solirubrobacteraceae bacterium]|nr:hypothetical protein [Solirubrobacteraceae bacterium]
MYRPHATAPQALTGLASDPKLVQHLDQLAAATDEIKGNAARFVAPLTAPPVALIL